MKCNDAYTGEELVEDYEDAPWLHQLGGLVPLLVAYEEELKQLKVKFKRFVKTDC